jgi:hypothetical protein
MPGACWTSTAMWRPAAHSSGRCGLGVAQSAATALLSALVRCSPKAAQLVHLTLPLPEARAPV